MAANSSKAKPSKRVAAKPAKTKAPIAVVREIAQALAHPDGVAVGRVHGLVAVYFALLLALRIVWRLSERTPHPLTESATWEKWAAHGAHLGLYALMIAMIVTGYLMWSGLPNRFDPARAAFFDYNLFGVFKMTGIHALADRPTSKYWEAWHETRSHFMEALVAIHIAAALWHQVFKRDIVMSRMIRGDVQ